MKIDKNILMVGQVLMYSWAMMLCIFSALYAPLGVSTGVHIGHYMVGAVSRYWDPFILGVLVIFSFLAWRHQPPSCWRVRNFSWQSVGDDILMGFWVSVVLSSVLMIFWKSHVSLYNIPPIICLYTIMLLIPFGWRGVIASLTLVTLISWLKLGLLVAGIFFVATWLGKWAIWWLVNIIWFGCRDTFMKLKGRLPIDHSREGSDVSPEQFSL
jgi:hypothetical protein